ncbi:unnamed protein product [Allacma fusca]|uniref:Uncharacterized protein n=1 Tax=Allacma fusca TaxID=39272 RepID=A0A8J2JUW8_9HEXA|nr:unnamed protein product [Allacma fusca]
MEQMEPIDDLEIQEKVESLVGKGSRVIDCEKSTTFQTQEVLLVNGFPVPLNGEEGARIKKALLTGQVPPCELLNEILIRAGILKTPVELETTMNVKSTTRTTELLTLRDRNGVLVDERVKEIEEDNEFKSASKEIWRKEEDSEDFEMLGKSFEKLNLNYFSDSNPSPSSSQTNHCSQTSRDSSVPLSSNASLPSRIHSSYTPPPLVPNTILTSNGKPTTSSYGSCTSSSEPTPEAAVSSSSDSNSHSSHASIDHGSNLKSVKNRDHTLVYADTNLVSGTLDGLIEQLVPTETIYADRPFTFAFLLSSRLHIPPYELLGRIFKAAFTTQQSSSNQVPINETKIVSRLVQLLGDWAELFPYDFRDERMMVHVRTITQKCVAIHPLIRNEVSQLLSALLARLTRLEKYEDFLHRINTEAALSVPQTSPSILSICPNPTMLAQQLTHIELERLSYIGPEEFVQAFAKDNDQVETNYNDMKKTRNLECYVQWFNRLSFFVASEICKVSKKKSRIRVVEYWIETARECFNIGNFNSLMAIIAGLNMSPVARLKKTWSKISSAQLSILEHQMDPTSNFSSYRSTLKAAVWRSAGATDERQRIVIPFFSLLVKDLYFLNEGCASKLPNGHINVEKFWQFAKQVSEVITWQQVGCSFPKVQTVLNSLHTAPIFDEKALSLASFECESADNSQEKERLKVLKRDDSLSNIEITDCIPKTTTFACSLLSGASKSFQIPAHQRLTPSELSSPLKKNMNHMDPIDDVLIQEKVESLAGKGTRVVDCEKSTTFKTNEIVLVNGYPVPLIGDEGAQLKRHLLEGQIPSGELLNVILIRAGILTAPVELETTFNVKSTTKTTELLTLRDKDGVLLDERIKEVEEDNEFSNKNTERWNKEESQDEEELKRLGRRVERIYPGQVDSVGLRREPLGGTSGREGSETCQSSEHESRTSSSLPSPQRDSSLKSEHHEVDTSSDSSGETMRTEKTSGRVLAPPEIFRSISDALSSTPLTRTPSDYNVPQNPQTPNHLPYVDKYKYKQFHPSLSLVPTELNGKPIRFTYETFV